MKPNPLESGPLPRIARTRLLALIVCLVWPVAAVAQDKKPDEKTRIQIAEYMLKTPVNEASTAVVEPFLALDADALPKRLRAKTRAKQLEIRTLLKLHDTKKKGGILQPVAGCTASSFVKPTKDIPTYQLAGFVEITEDEELQVTKRTLCQEIDLGCQFSLMIFYDAGSKKPRRLFLMENDPIMAIVAQVRSNVGGNRYFGTGFSCMSR